MAGRDELGRMLAALDQLPDAQRLALVLLQVRELPATEIAAMLGVPVGTVYSRAFLARKRLRELLLSESACGQPSEVAGSAEP